MKLSKSITYLIRSRIIIFWSVFFALHILVSVPFIFIPEEWTKSTYLQEVDHFEKLGQFFLSVALGPLFETFVFQFSIIQIVRLLIKKAKWAMLISVPLSALLFSLNHYYFPAYMVATFLTGLIYAFAYYIARYRRDLPAFLVVAILHSFWNLFAFGMNELVL